jgi:hypothetical protein
VTPTTYRKDHSVKHVIYNVKMQTVLLYYDVILFIVERAHDTCITYIEEVFARCHNVVDAST